MQYPLRFKIIYCYWDMLFILIWRINRRETQSTCDRIFNYMLVCNNHWYMLTCGLVFTKVEKVQYVVFLYTLFYFYLIINSCCSGSGFQPDGSFFRGWWRIVFSKFQGSDFPQWRISLMRNRWNKKNCLRFLKQLTSICGWCHSQVSLSSKQSTKLSNSQL